MTEGHMAWSRLPSCLLLLLNLHSHQLKTKNPAVSGRVLRIYITKKIISF